jgi:predicted AAA+ superfamily ATPase
MLKRKLTERLNNWKNDPNKKPLVIKGVRQCGNYVKSEIM